MEQAEIDALVNQWGKETNCLDSEGHLVSVGFDMEWVEGAKDFAKWLSKNGKL